MDSAAGDIASVLRSAWTGSELVHALTQHNKLFFFSYSPRLKSLVSWSSNCKEILGISEASIARDANLFLRHTHHEDRFRLLPALESALRDGTNYRVTYRWVRPDNKELSWLHCRAKLSRYDDENLFEGVIIDLTEEIGLHQNSVGSENGLKILNSLPFAVGILDSDLRVTQLSSEMEGLNFGDVDFSLEYFQPGRHFLRCFKNTVLREQYRSALLSIVRGQELEQELAYTFDNRWIRIILRPIENDDGPPGIAVSAVDRSESVLLIREVDELRESKRAELLTYAVLTSIKVELQKLGTNLNSTTNFTNNKPQQLQAINNCLRELSDLENTLHDYSTKIPNNTSIPHSLNLLVANAVKRSNSLFSAGRSVQLNISSTARIMGNSNKIRELFVMFVEQAASLMPSNSIVLVTTLTDPSEPLATCEVSLKPSNTTPGSLNPDDERLHRWDEIRSLADDLGAIIRFEYRENGLAAIRLVTPTILG